MNAIPKEFISMVYCLIFQKNGSLQLTLKQTEKMTGSIFKFVEFQMKATIYYLIALAIQHKKSRHHFNTAYSK